jgi:HD-GYP domain-containing protein (c-di-GMP phosphodiesterase class II)
VHPELEQLRPKLKEVLYDCATEIRATKAALFLFDGTSRFELFTEYGFRGGVRKEADNNDPLIDRCGRGRTPFFVNGLAVEPRLSEILYEASTDRLLAAPMFSRGKLIGIIDMRDKAGKLPFDAADLIKAQHIADRMVEVLADKNVFGHRFIALSNVTTQHPAVRLEDMQPAVAAEQRAPAAPPAPEPLSAPAIAPAPRQTTPARPAARTDGPSLSSIVLDARTAITRLHSAPPAELLTEQDLNAARDVLRSILLIPGSVAATFSAYGHLGGVQEMIARSTLNDDARTLIESKLKAWLERRGEAAGYVRTAILAPSAPGGPPVTAADVQKVFTAPLAVGNATGLYLTVVFSSNPDRLAHDLLALMHSHLQVVLEQSMRRGALASLHMRVAERLLQPDFAKYPELRRHSEAVANVTTGFARFLNLPPADAEALRLLAMVHDVGLRLLDYERLYRKRDLAPDEISLLREHPVIGAALVEPLLGSEIARAVLSHHERFDGRGYPAGLHGEEIPLFSRILQICDAWVAMTDPESYQTPSAPEAALATIVNAASGQFDTELAGKFADMIRRM